MADKLITEAPGGERVEINGTEYVLVSFGGTSYYVSLATILGNADFANAVHTHSTDAIVSGTFADARISESSVLQHKAAIVLEPDQVSAPVTASSYSPLTATVEGHLVGIANAIGAKAASVHAHQASSVVVDSVPQNYTTLSSALDDHLDGIDTYLGSLDEDIGAIEGDLVENYMPVVGVKSIHVKSEDYTALDNHAGVRMFMLSDVDIYFNIGTQASRLYREGSAWEVWQIGTGSAVIKAVGGVLLNGENGGEVRIDSQYKAVLVARVTDDEWVCTVV